MSNAKPETAAEKRAKYGSSPTPAQARLIRKTVNKEKGREKK